MIFGWNTCLTYETKKRLGFEHFSKLLDEMKENGMKRINILTGAYGYYDLRNHGLAWSVQNPKLKPMVDTNSINSSEATEFLSKVIQKARRIGIELYLGTKYQGVRGLKKGYPDVHFQTDRKGKLYNDRPGLNKEERKLSLVFSPCHDDDLVHQYMRDKITDLLERYPEIDGLIMEWPGYQGDGCYCKSTQRAFQADTGKDIFKATEEERVKWQNKSVEKRVADLVSLAKGINKDIRFGFYAGQYRNNLEQSIKSLNSVGRSKQTLQNSGLDLILPFLEGREYEKGTEGLEKIIDYLWPLPCYVVCCVRKNPPEKYPLPPKDPEYIKQVVKWAKSYRKTDNFEGMTFLNEVNVPKENRDVLYDCTKGP